MRQCTPCAPKEIFCNSIDQEYVDKLKISTALLKKFPFQSDRANHVCLYKYFANQFIKNNWTSSKFQLPLAPLFISNKTDSTHYAYLTKELAIQLINNIWTSSNFNCLQQKNCISNITGSAYFVCLTKQSAIRVIINI